MELTTSEPSGRAAAGIVIASASVLLAPQSYAFAGGVAVVFSARSPAKDTANEDSAALIPLGAGRGLIVVADGLGGHPDGEQASAIAVEALARAVVRDDGNGSGDLRNAILQGIDDANRRILALGTGSATTISVVEISDDSLRTYHVGDSMIVVTGQRGKLKLQTIPHSPVGYAVESGLIDEAEAMGADNRHIVSNVVGCENMRIEMGPQRKLAARDTVAVASDGLSDNLVPDEIVAGIRRGPLLDCAQNLLAKSQQRMTTPADDVGGHPDDLTVVLFRRR